MSKRRTDKPSPATTGRRGGAVPSGSHGLKREDASVALGACPAWVRIGLPLAVFVIVFVTFIPALRGEFLNWDDDKNFIDNPYWRGLGPAQIEWMFTAFHQGHYRPLTWLTLGFNYELGQMNPWGYHLLNSLLHATNAVLLYWLAMRLIALGMRPIAAGEGVWLRIAAAIAALLFGVHPLRVESVAWITERRDLVSGLLILLTMLAYLRYATAPPGRWAMWYGLVIVGLVASLMAKVIGITVPAVMLVLDWFPLRRMNFADWRATKLVVAEKIPMLTIAAIFGGIVTHFDREAGWLVTLADHPLPARVAQMMYGLVFYAWKTLVPMNLVPLYEMDRAMYPFQGKYLAYGLIVMGCAIALLALRRRIPGVVAAALAYAILLGPTLGLVQTGPQLVADRYSYLSCMGWAILAGALVLHLARWRLVAGRIAVGISAVAVCALAMASWQQSMVWRDNFTLWSYACAKKNVESTFSWSKYGLLLRDRNDLEGSAAALRRAIDIRPDNSKAHMYLGNTYNRMGRADAALEEYRTAMKFDPGAYEPVYNYGYVLMQQQRFAEAADALAQALQRMPADTPRLNRSLADAHGNLALVLLQLNRVDEAAEHIRQVKLLDPSRAQSLEEAANAIIAEKKKQK